ncbi:MAG: helix-turn-helix domain-containing protein [Clostridia bacterium]|nr:helix-turn-helix domain-containing protein [Clostridia bacterium]
MPKLSINDWMISPSIQLISKITEDESDHYYHDHNFFEIFYVLSGTIIHNCNGKKETLETGDIRLLRLKDKHSFIRKDNAPCSHRDIIITEQLFKKSCDFISPSLFEEINQRREPLKSKIKQTKIVEFEKEFSKIFFMPAQKGIHTKETMANILSIELLNIFLQEFQPQHSGLPVWLNNILPSFSAPILMREGLELILKDINYDKSYICRTFKKYIGCTMTEYLHAQRIDYAMSLLLTTDKTIAQICEEVGFQSIPYFTTSFKNKYSLSPKQFKLNFFNR